MDIAIAAPRQLYGVESVRSWVRQADVANGVKPGLTTEEAEKIKKFWAAVAAVRFVGGRVGARHRCGPSIQVLVARSVPKVHDLLLVVRS